MASDHLNELRRQRALVQQQLDWLDREIARNKPETETSASIPVVQIAQKSLSTTDILISEPDPLAASQNAKRGCLLYFCALIALLAALMVALYFWKYRDRPILFAEHNPTAVVSRTVTRLSAS